MKLPAHSELAIQLRRDVEALCLPEGRMVGSAGHGVAEQFLRSRLSESGCIPYSGKAFDLPYIDSGIEFTNLIGVIPGIDRSLPPLLIGAHYDGVIDAPCADDNGAAVAICLAIATAARVGSGLTRDLVVAFFDAEEPPYFLSTAMGSNRFHAEQMDQRGVHFALIFDLVGHDVEIPPEFVSLVGDSGLLTGSDFRVPDLRGLLFVTGAESNPELPGVLSETAVPPGLNLLATLNDYVGDMSDHGVFRRNDIPYLFFSCGRWEHYHRVTDTPDRLNYKKMALITNLCADILSRLSVESLSDRSTEDHTLEFEIQTLHNGLGELMPLIMRYMGLSRLETRADLRKIVEGILSLGV